MLTRRSVTNFVSFELLARLAEAQPLYAEDATIVVSTVELLYLLSVCIA